MAKEPALKKSTRTKRTPAKRRRVVAKKAVRKAPTRVANKEQSLFNIKIVFSVLIAAVVVSSAGVYIGMSDTGEIDVSQTIGKKADSLEAQGDIVGSEAVRSISASNNTQGKDSRIKLIGSGNAETEQQRREQQRKSQSMNVASDNTSTDEDVDTATSSSEVNEESVDAELDEEAQTTSAAGTDSEQGPETEEVQTEPIESDNDTAAPDGPGR